MGVYSRRFTRPTLQTYDSQPQHKHNGEASHSLNSSFGKTCVRVCERVISTFLMRFVNCSCIFNGLFKIFDLAACRKKLTHLYFSLFLLKYTQYTGALVKQADVVLLGYPLMLNMTIAVRANDAAYYLAKTDPNGPAMTWGKCSLDRWSVLVCMYSVRVCAGFFLCLCFYLCLWHAHSNDDAYR